VNAAGGLRRNATVADEAAEWLATLSDSACTIEERQQFAGWLRRSNLHVEEFLQLSVLARQLSEPSIWGDTSAEELIAEALGSRNTVASLDSRHSTLRRSAFQQKRWLLPLSAACVLAAVATFFFSGDLFPGLFDGPGNTYATVVGEQRSIPLEDGSIVELNTQSSLRTRFTAAERTVELLRGEAIFKVAKNAQRPFRVISGGSQIVAVGTAFNVYSRSAGAGTVVTVIEGRVRVSHTDDESSRNPGTDQQHPADDIELARGEQAVIVPKRPIVRIALEDPAKATAWTERRLIFEETPLAAVTAEFARYYTAKTIRIADPALADLHITGVFDASDPASLVEFLQTFGAIDIQEDERGWILVGSRSGDSTLVQRP
jgi:transmembrane sensor